MVQKPYKRRSLVRRKALFTTQIAVLVVGLGHVLGRSEGGDEVVHV